MPGKRLLQPEHNAVGRRLAWAGFQHTRISASSFTFIQQSPFHIHQENAHTALCLYKLVHSCKTTWCLVVSQTYFAFNFVLFSILFLMKPLFSSNNIFCICPFLTGLPPAAAPSTLPTPTNTTPPRTLLASPPTAALQHTHTIPPPTHQQQCASTDSFSRITYLSQRGVGAYTHFGRIWGGWGVGGRSTHYTPTSHTHLCITDTLQIEHRHPLWGSVVSGSGCDGKVGLPD